MSNRLVYSGNPKIVVYMLVLVALAIVGTIWLYHATDKPMTPRELWQLEESQ